MQMMALNAYENGGSKRLCKGEKKIDNLYTRDMPQYQRCIKLLKCRMKQEAANIVMRKKTTHHDKGLKKYKHKSLYISNKFLLN